MFNRFVLQTLRKAADANSHVDAIPDFAIVDHQIQQCNSTLIAKAEQIKITLQKRFLRVVKYVIAQLISGDLNVFITQAN